VTHDHVTSHSSTNNNTNWLKFPSTTLVKGKISSNKGSTNNTFLGYPSKYKDDITTDVITQPVSVLGKTTINQHGCRLHLQVPLVVILFCQPEVFSYPAPAGRVQQPTISSEMVIFQHLHLLVGEEKAVSRDSTSQQLVSFGGQTVVVVLV